MEGLQWKKVKLLPHDEQWEREFEKTRQLLCRIWGDAVIDVQHVGSTAIRGICAKPILDVAVVVKSLAGMNVKAMTDAGYQYMGARSENKDRHMFALYAAKDGAEDVVIEHIHCYEPGNRGFTDSVLFRDYLNAHPKAAREYDAVKRRSAALNPDDRFAYSDGKRAFIEKIYGEMRKWR